MPLRSRVAQPRRRYNPQGGLEEMSSAMHVACLCGMRAYGMFHCVPTKVGGRQLSGEVVVGCVVGMKCARRGQ